MINRSAVLTTLQPQKKYLDLGEGKVKKQRYYNHTQSFQNENYLGSITLSSYFSEIRKKEKGKHQH